MTDELLQAALAGASRNGTGPLQPESPAEALGEGMGLLLRAGLRDVYRRAGYVPSPAPEPFPPAPDVEETVCPPVMEQALWEMIERGSSLPSAPREALRALARRGWVLPSGVLVQALSNQLKLPEVSSVLGERGRWLAGLNGAWQWAVAGERALDPSEADRIWAEGTKTERAALIRRLRESDAAGARERVAAGFRSEPADLRQELVRALEINLSSADEPFLETALDDRSKGVRQAAAALLARLPESAFVGRMVERARGLVVRRRLRGGVTLRPAPDLPDDWRRDGIGLALPGGLADELARTIQVLSSIPAVVLTREVGVSPEEVVEAADQNAAVLLIEAWCQNVSSDDRDALLPRLWDVWWAKLPKGMMAPVTLVKLTQAIPPDVLQRRVLRLLDDPPEGAEAFILVALDEVGEPWPPDISRSALAVLRGWLERMARKDRHAGNWPRLIWSLAAHAAPETIEETLALLDGIERAKVLPSWSQGLLQGEDVLRLRRRFWDAMAMARMESMTSGGANGSGNR